ncbi:MAG: response regulator [Hyphomonadaceae bacterium]
MDGSSALDLFDATPDPAALFAADGARLRANAAFQRAFPHAAGATRPPWGRLQPPPFEHGERRFEAPAPNGRRYEWREVQLADGARLAIARDVTERVEAAEQAARAKTMLFATLTHELRTPLNGILGMAEVLSQSQLGAPEREYIAAIRGSGEHLLHLITDILDFARIHAESFEIRESIFDPEETVQSVAELLSPKAQEKGLDISVRIDSAAPLKVLGDESRLRQILFNLAGNAVKFTAAGEVAIEIAPAAAGRLRFTVRDTGPGVPEEMRRSIFEAFVQADPSPGRRVAGAGLGLAIVNKLASLLGGEAGLDSGERGAAFWVELPFAVIEAERRNMTLAGLSALVVSDAPLLAGGLMEGLRAAGAAPRIAKSLAEARAAAKPEILVLDHAVAQGDPQPYLALCSAVIVLVPQERRELLARYREAGAPFYLVKPVRRASLIGWGQAARERRAAPTPAPKPPRAEGLRVLMAEDDPLNALIARTLLERVGCIVDVVENGEAAVAAVRASAYDMAILDRRMPVLDGLAAARRIRALPGPVARMPLIALTADAGEEERAAALAAGMDDFLTKPIEPARLRDVLSRYAPAAAEG